MTNIKQCRYTNDRTKCIVKTDSPTLISKHTCYNFTEISKIVQNEEWKAEELE